MKNLFLHIGTEKTGTTSLQNFLALNEELLNLNNFTYCCDPKKSYYEQIDPIINLGAHYPLSACFSTNCPDYIKESKFKTSDIVLDELKKDLDDESKNVIISAEHFSSRVRSIEDIFKLKTALSSHNVKVVVYIRPQYDLICSAYTTSVISGRTDKFELSEACIGNEYFNYELLIEPWGKVFGAQNIIIRDYKQLVNNDIRYDFIKIIGIENQSQFFYDHNINISIGAKKIEAVRLINNYLPLFGTVAQEIWLRSNEIRNVLLQHFIMEDLESKNMISLVDKIAIYYLYLCSNKVIQQKYMHEDALSGWGSCLIDDTSPESRSTINTISALEMAESMVKLGEHIIDTENTLIYKNNEIDMLKQQLTCVTQELESLKRM
jgi:hypothetical protein